MIMVAVYFVVRKAFSEMSTAKKGLTYGLMLFFLKGISGFMAMALLGGSEKLCFCKPFCNNF